jgi:hypothetical protein
VVFKTYNLSTANYWMCIFYFCPVFQKSEEMARNGTICSILFVYFMVVMSTAGQYCPKLLKRTGPSSFINRQGKFWNWINFFVQQSKGQNFKICAPWNVIRWLKWYNLFYSPCLLYGCHVNGWSILSKT